MAAEKKFGSAKRFGSRYGRKIRDKVAMVEKERKKKHKCPYCHKIGGIKRIAVGIWNCTKCESKFTAKAYTISKKRTKKPVADKKKVVEEEDIDEELPEEDLQDSKNLEKDLDREESNEE